jgi:hypothetical protein
MTDYEIARLQLARRWWMHPVRSQLSYAIVAAGAEAALRGAATTQGDFIVTALREKLDRTTSARRAKR